MEKDHKSRDMNLGAKIIKWPVLGQKKYTSLLQYNFGHAVFQWKLKV